MAIWRALNYMNYRRTGQAGVVAPPAPRTAHFLAHWRMRLRAAMRPHALGDTHSGDAHTYTYTVKHAVRAQFAPHMQVAQLSVAYMPLVVSVWLLTRIHPLGPQTHISGVCCTISAWQHTPGRGGEECVYGGGGGQVHRHTHMT